MKGTVLYFDVGNTLLHYVNGELEPIVGAVDTVSQLWWSGYKIGFLSDQPVGTTVNELAQTMRDYGFHLFDVITISSEFTPPVTKPDPQIFQRAVEKSKHTSASEKTVFITEILGHVEVARNLGWRAIHVPYNLPCASSSGDCVESLEELLDLFPPIPTDVCLRDAEADPGDDDSTGFSWWNSPDLWIRNAEDDGLEHQSPIYERDNWLYARIYNRGESMARFPSVTHYIKQWAGTEFVYPSDFSPAVASVGGGSIDWEESQIVHTKWNAGDIPPAGTHPCWLARAWGQYDQIPADIHVWESNNLAQKNLTIVELSPDENESFAFKIGSRFNFCIRQLHLDIIRPKECLNLKVSLSTTTPKNLEHILKRDRKSLNSIIGHSEQKDSWFRFLDDTRIEFADPVLARSRLVFEMKKGSTFKVSQETPGSPASPVPQKVVRAKARILRDAERNSFVQFDNGKTSGIPIHLKAGQFIAAILNVTAPKDARPGEVYHLHCVQRDLNERIVGGITIEIRIKKKK